jgi:hypothetical protein
MSRSCLLALASVIAVGASAVCDQGLILTLDSQANQDAMDRAYADSGDYSGSHRLGLRGSFVARTTESHTFEVWSEVYTAESWFATSVARFKWEDSSQGESAGRWRPAALSLTKDFRYQLEVHTVDGHFYMRISVSVSFTGREMAVLDGDLIGICHENGCRDTALERSRYACQPDPTQSPTPTRSHSPTATASLAFVPSLVLQSRSFHLSARLFDSNAFSPSHPPPQSGVSSPSMSRPDSIGLVS